jgi:hypothetical protein
MTGSACTALCDQKWVNASQLNIRVERRRATEIHAAFLLTPNLVGRKMRQQLNIY